jgi:hypothetical protein
MCLDLEICCQGPVICEYMTNFCQYCVGVKGGHLLWEKDVCLKTECSGEHVDLWKMELVGSLGCCTSNLVSSGGVRIVTMSYDEARA